MKTTPELYLAQVSLPGLHLAWPFSAAPSGALRLLRPAGYKSDGHREKWGSSSSSLSE